MPGEAPKAVECLNELIVNALGHAMDCLKYLERLQDVPVFRFCAIPQVPTPGCTILLACLPVLPMPGRTLPLGPPPVPP